jgi:hypothetical protein
MADIPGKEGQKSLPDLIKAAVEVTQPDLRHYYKMPKKALVVGTYASNGMYFCDVQPLHNDDSIDIDEPVIQKVEIPVIWAGPMRGVVCPPAPGTYCDLTYYDGDPNYPRISNFRWHNMGAPVAALNEFVIQLQPGVEIRIDMLRHIVMLTPESTRTKAGKNMDAAAGINWTVIAGVGASIKAGVDATITAGDNATITAGREATLQAGTIANIVAPLINLCGRLICKPFKGIGRGYAEFEGDIKILGNEDVVGNTSVAGSNSIGGNNTVGGNSTVAGNSFASSRSGGSCPH